MTNDPRTASHPAGEKLSEYLDGGLVEGERLELEAHLHGCESCSTLMDELRDVVEQAHRLESLPPELDLWPGIEVRLTTKVHPIAHWLGIGSRDGGTRISFTLPQLAAAAAALIVFSGAGAWWLASRAPIGAGIPASGASTGVSVSGPVGPSPTAMTTPSGETHAQDLAAAPATSIRRPEAGVQIMNAGFDESRYQSAITELSAVLRDHRNELDPLTVKVLEENLATIDRAILAARKALEADPGSGYLSGHLAQQLQLKVWLLRRAADVVAAAHG